jgi:hypothetical protein
MTDNSHQFDQWIRGRFCSLNTSLEALYWEQPDRAQTASIGTSLKQALESEGREIIEALLHEGNTDEGFDSGFDLLGNVGLYMAACRRHEITEPSREQVSPLTAASTLAMQIGASSGVTPRFATAHLTTHNRAVDGVYKRFTDLPDEQLFVDYNTRGIFGYKRAAEALLKILPLGISHPVAAELLFSAQQALTDVQHTNQILFEQLDANRFFYSVRPYYKPYRVGSQVYRGANAGDFAGINIIDMLLGLCFANEPAYSQMLVDKFLFMMPDDQQMLRDAMRRRSFMDDFLDATEQQQKTTWYQHNLSAFMGVCDQHAKIAVQHHDQLVSKYIVIPSTSMGTEHLDNVTASGPPLHVLINALEKLRDRRTAAQRDDIRTRYADMKRLRASLDNAL